MVVLMLIFVKLPNSEMKVFICLHNKFHFVVILGPTAAPTFRSTFQQNGQNK